MKPLTAFMFGVAIVLALPRCGTAMTAASPVRLSTHADPPTFTPPPTLEGQSDTTVGLRVSGGFTRAREVALRLLLAVRDKDVAALDALLAPELIAFSPGLGRRQPRERLMAQIARPSARSQVGPQTPLEELVVVEQLRAEPVATRGRGDAVPAGLEAGDVVVSFDIRPMGVMVFRERALPWPDRGAVVVRLGAAAPVVGL